MKLFEKNNILIARFSSIGDVVLTTPILRALKEQLPEIKISYLTTRQMSCLIEDNPYIDSLFLFDKKDSKNEILNLKMKILEHNQRQKFDIAIDLQNNLRSKFMLKGLYKRKLKFNKNRLFKLALVHFKYLTKEPRHIVERYFDTLKILNVSNNNYKPEIFIENTQNCEKTKLIIGIAHGANHFTKQWITEYYAELIDLLNDSYNVQFYLFGSSPEIKNSSKIIKLSNAQISDFTGKLSLKETIMKISECDYFISNDTGLMHIASAINKPIVAIFGSTVPELGFSPYGVPHHIAQIQLSCRPCTHIGRASCPRKHFDCMRKLTPDIVLAEFNMLMNNIKQKN